MRIRFVQSNSSFTFINVNIVIQVLNKNLPTQGNDTLYLLKKDSPDSVMPTVLSPIAQTSNVNTILKTSDKGLSDFGLKMALGETVSTPHTLMVTDDAYATLVLGFPELEFSENEVYTWPKSKDTLKLSSQVQPSNSLYAGRKYHDLSRNMVSEKTFFL